MAKTFRPLIGLAVVVTLAVVAVFGIMSLAASPAQAQTVTELQIKMKSGSRSATFSFDDQSAFDNVTQWRHRHRENASNSGFTNWINFTPTVTEGAGINADTLSYTVTGLVDNIQLIFEVDGLQNGTRIVWSSVTDQSDEGVVTPASPGPSVTFSGTPTLDQLTYTNGNNIPGSILIKWSFTPPEEDEVRIDYWQYQVTPIVNSQDDVPGPWTSMEEDDIIVNPDGDNSSERGYRVNGITAENIKVTVRAVRQYATTFTPATSSTSNSYIIEALPPPRMPPSPERTARETTFEPESIEPGANSRYDISFLTTKPVDTLTDAELVLKLEDFSLPSTINASTVAITVVDPATVPGSSAGDLPDYQDRDFIPADVTVGGDEITISLGNTLSGEDTIQDFDISTASIITVIIRKSAGISNPTKYGEYGVSITLGDKAVDLDWKRERVDPNDANNKVKAYPHLSFNVPRTVSIDPEEGSLGDKVTVTAKGFRNGTSLTVFVDAPSLHVDEDNNPNTPADNDDRDPATTDPFKIPDGKLGAGEDIVCVVSEISSSDIAECEFEVTHPTFSSAVNYINAVDGRTGYAGVMEPNTPTNVTWERNGQGDPVVKHDYLTEFLLEASLKASPDSGSPGQIILLQVVDFPPGNISKIEIARQILCTGTCGNVDPQGNGNMSVTIPNGVNAGAQEVRVTSGVNPAVTATTTITFVGPNIQVNPREVLPNQRISLIGTGFSPGAVIANDAEVDQNAPHSITIGGQTIPGNRINDSQPVRVDNGGNWSASLDLPLVEATTAEGERAIRVTDSQGRSGLALVTIPSREVTVTPESGRVGTMAVIRGTGFPSKNDDGSSFNVEVVYDASNGNTTTVSALPDTGGTFETQLRIPTTASIPSSNSIKVSFEDTEGVDVITTVTHNVPEGAITLSETSGGPGSTVTINGTGFKSYVPVALVKVGTLDVIPSPKPSTDANGMMSFDIIIPGLDVGIQTIEVEVGRTTASTGFTVIESGISTGAITPVAEAVEGLGYNLVSVWHFNNDTKVWSFYDPILEDENTLTHIITGETYLIRINSTVDVILNNETRSLTCIAANCWNHVVW